MGGEWVVDKYQCMNRRIIFRNSKNYLFAGFTPLLWLCTKMGMHANAVLSAQAIPNYLKAGVGTWENVTVPFFLSRYFFMTEKEILLRKKYNFHSEKYRFYSISIASDGQTSTQVSQSTHMSLSTFAFSLSIAIAEADTHSHTSHTRCISPCPLLLPSLSLHHNCF